MFQWQPPPPSSGQVRCELSVITVVAATETYLKWNNFVTPVLQSVSGAVLLKACRQQLGSKTRGVNNSAQFVVFSF
jgi:hypothetical protein